MPETQDDRSTGDAEGRTSWAASAAFKAPNREWLTTEGPTSRFRNASGRPPGRPSWSRRRRR